MAVAHAHPATDPAVRRRLRRGATPLLVAFVAGPVVFLAMLHAFYPAAARLCPSPVAFHVGSALALLLVLGAGVMAHRQWRGAGGARAAGDGGQERRTRFLAIAGMLSSAIFALLIIAQWLPVFFFPPCAAQGL